MLTKKVSFVALLITLVIVVTIVLLNRGSDRVAGAVQTGVDVTTTNFTSLSSANGISNGGVFTTAVRNASLTQATTTVCAIQSPNATSTVSNASLLLTVASSTATVVTIATAATPYATTTFLGNGSIAANAQGTVYAGSTSTNAVIAPNAYVVFGMSGGIGTFSPTGVCTATFQISQ